ncbi:MAG: hypothetical protein ACE5I4_06705 [Thermoplasmata archaeon]
MIIVRAVGWSFIDGGRFDRVAEAEKAFGGLCEFCSYEGPFDRKEETGEFVCPQCGQPPRDAPEDEWLG